MVPADPLADGEGGYLCPVCHAKITWPRPPDFWSPQPESGTDPAWSYGWLLWHERSELRRTCPMCKCIGFVSLENVKWYYRTARGEKIGPLSIKQLPLTHPS